MVGQQGSRRLIWVADCSKNLWIENPIVNAGLRMAFKHRIWFATVFAANFGCDRFRIMPDIISKLLRAAIRNIVHDEVYVGMTLVSQATSAGSASKMWAVPRGPGFGSNRPVSGTVTPDRSAESMVQQWLSPSTLDSTLVTGRVTQTGEDSTWEWSMLRQW